MTKEQYSGQYRPTVNIFNVSRDVMNPELNTELLKNRIRLIDYYKYRHGVNHTYWVHSFLSRQGNKLNKYKFNYAIKAFLAYQVYSKYKNYRFVDDMTFMTNEQRVAHASPVVTSAGVFTLACLLF